ncbi:hypothetical protein M7775_07930 [Sporomusa sphaeroides DSM 2875]|uniref:hypothetical protein n=1 Tax=Sporomusa sphaeroides TaxID=47679 RepID=UPI0020305C38|nr:hypothetical protein [Sporomusa sphaeroides]MCM0758498.1 hypothetical protein [Sporomusa sphaeroides DSM 2875]
MQSFLNYAQNPTLTDLNNKIDALVAKFKALESVAVGTQGANIPVTTGEYSYSSREKCREEFVAENTNAWQQIGLKYKTWRLSQCLPKSYVARNIGIAPSTLTKFEDGKPCKIAKTIQAAYELLMENRELHTVNLRKKQENVKRLQQELDSVNMAIRQYLRGTEEMAVMN